MFNVAPGPTVKPLSFDSVSATAAVTLFVPVRVKLVARASPPASAVLSKSAALSAMFNVAPGPTVKPLSFDSVSATAAVTLFVPVRVKLVARASPPASAVLSKSVALSAMFNVAPGPTVKPLSFDSVSATAAVTLFVPVRVKLVARASPPASAVLSKSVALSAMFNVAPGPTVKPLSFDSVSATAAVTLFVPVRVKLVASASPPALAVLSRSVALSAMFNVAPGPTVKPLSFDSVSATAAVTLFVPVRVKLVARASPPASAVLSRSAALSADAAPQLEQHENGAKCHT